MRMLHKLGVRNYFSEISFLLILCVDKIQKGGIIGSKDGKLRKGEEFMEKQYDVIARSWKESNKRFLAAL